MILQNEALKIKQGAENYAEQVLNNIDTDLSQLQQIVRNGQAYIEKMKEETYHGITSQRMVEQSVMYDDFE